MPLELAVDNEPTWDEAGYAEQIRAAAEFRVDVAREPDTVRICPVGELDVATIAHLRVQVEEALAAGISRVILDRRETTFLDSTALHLAVDAYSRAKREGIEFAIVPGPHA